ncbi:MAG TPA: hypothetical protein VKU40_00780, partial [Thermoanaerobaculia bacterium]|nr:hypothetical protein [Thermoanaerobaculia bacterium]
LAEGAALWLTGDWFGRPWRDWLPRLAVADVLPTAAELLAAEEPADGSRVLWTPVAAAFVGALPGETLADKLGRLPAEAEVETWLGFFAESAEWPHDAARRGGVEPLPPFMAGVSLAMLNHVDLGYHAPSVAASMDHLERAVGADAVSLMPFAFQADPNAPEMRYLNRSPGSETDVSMLHAAKRARERGVTVLWKPQIWLRSSWPGEIELTSEADRAAWFRAYRRYVVHQAVLAEWAGADLFSVGVELGKTVEHEAEWRHLIAAVRLFYAGPLTYSANWYGDFDRVPFWDALDLLGIDAYQPLAESPEASEEELRAGARRAVETMAAAVELHGKGLVITELGYAAHEAAWVAPHEEGGPYSEADQATAYRVMLDELGHPDWLRGVFVWKAFSNGPDDVPRRGRRTQRANFSFLDREAEAVIARYYRAR